ncbi:MAG TPA: MMPL family transporter, partial [Stellaceae bacterium]
LLALLPQEERDATVQHAKEKVAALFGQRIVLLVGHDDRDAARSAGAELAQALGDSGVASSVTFTLPSDGLLRLGQMFFPYRFGLLTAADRQRLEEGRGAEIVARALANVYGPAAIADGTLLRRDPFLLLPSFLTELPTPLPRLVPDEGVLSVRDGAKTYVLISAQLSGDAFTLAVQDRFMRVFAAAEEKLRSRLPDLRVLRFGAVFYAHAGASAATQETSALSIVSLLGTVALVLVVFRALRPLWLTALAIGVGVVCAFSVSLWLFGTLHVAALLIGVSLIGISLDYCLQYLSARFDLAANTPRRRLYRVLPGISLGIATTLVGYATLLLAPFPGLHQVAVFSAVGLVASFVTVLLWLPALDGREPFRHGARLLAASGWLWAFWEEPRYRWPRAALVLLLLALALGGATRLHVDDDVRRLQALSDDLKRQEADVRRLTGISGGTEFLLVRAADSERALQTEEMLADRLAAAKRDGAIANYQALAQVIPSAARQQADRALVRDKLLGPFLADYYDRLGIADHAVAQEKDQGFLTPAAITADSPLSFLRNLVIEDDAAGATHLVLLNGVSRLEQVRQASEAVPGVRLIDPAGDVTRLLGEYRRRAVLLLALSGVLMLPLIAWRYGLAGGFRVLLPPAASVLLTPPLVALAGFPFTFFSAMALVLVLSIGFDYAVFCKETDPAQRPVTMLGVWLAMVTTLLSFGLLAFSRVFAVQAFGMTLLVGTSLAFLASPLTGDSRGVRGRMKKN